MKIAVITGASSGMGREFVRQFDRKETFDEIWVIARRAERLEALRGEGRAPLRPLPMDLTEDDSLDRFRSLLSEENPEIALLVNASGFGIFRAFAEAPLETQLSMIDLNDKALVAMTYLALPYMVSGSRIVNMGSLSAFQPVLLYQRIRGQQGLRTQLQPGAGSGAEAPGHPGHGRVPGLGAHGVL